MERDNWRVERTRPSPWGALALVILTGLALIRNGADVSPDLPDTSAVVDHVEARGEAPGPVTLSASAAP
ncbi:hypothetical protein ACFVH0_25305 [Streptomyces sp. NPDC127117]|uniref:hypothetical protein n=1 Tax=Streptomyces sp. NPDC127117 TaxID=3345368 RepID=UPI003644EEC9